MLDRARAASEGYRWFPAWKRAAILERASHLIEENAEQIARIIAAEGGKPLKDARMEAKRGASTFRWASEEAKRTAGELVEMDADPSGEHHFGWTIREPRGVIAAISPFNFPLNLVAHKVAPALAGGNAVVLKPASNTPLTAMRLGGDPQRGRPPRRRPAGRRGLGQHHRQQDGDRRAHQHGELHRQPAGGPADRQGRRHEDGHAGAGQQLGHHRRGRRQPRARRPARRSPAASPTPARSASRCSASIVHEAVYDEFLARLVPLVEGAQGRRPARRDHRRGDAHQRRRGGARQGVGRRRRSTRAPRWPPAACARTAACCRPCSPT